MIIFYSAILVVFLIWTNVNMMFLPKMPVHFRQNHDDETSISILVPLRNESQNVKTLIQSLKNADITNAEFIFLDDQSTDDTYQQLIKRCEGWRHATVIQGKPLPDEWVGKVHACHQLSEHATGNILLFIDADLTIHPSALFAVRKMMSEKNAGMISGFPQFVLRTSLGRLLIPLQHFIIGFHLPLMLANHTNWAKASGAHGSFMAFSRSAYDQSGGHHAVKTEIVEDVALMRNVKNSGNRAILANITHLVHCDMYTSNLDVWNGFSKNIFPGIGRSLILATGLSCFYAAFFIFPLVLAVIGVFQHFILYVLPLVLVILIRASIDIRIKQPLYLALLHPFAITCLLALLTRSIYLDKSSRGFSWKGRTYQ